MKTVLIGVTGCVAIYKTCEIVRGLQKAGVRAKIVMTESATHFINPTLFRALTREPVAVGLFDDRPGDPIHHISLSKEADLFLIAPCTANVIAKVAHGIADGPVTMAAKSHLRNGRPLVIAVSTNDALAGAAENIGRLLNRKHCYFVPFGQDDPEKKPNSMVADFSKIPQTIVLAAAGKQLQPIILR